MADRPEWFAPKSHGIGSGWPTAWQGWVLLLAFAAAMVAIELVFGRRHEVALAIAAPVIVLFLFVVERTTPGGWRWRWGKRD